MMATPAPQVAAPSAPIVFDGLVNAKMVENDKPFLAVFFASISVLAKNYADTKKLPNLSDTTNNNNNNLRNNNNNISSVNQSTEQAADLFCMERENLEKQLVNEITRMFTSAQSNNNSSSGNNNNNMNNQAFVYLMSDSSKTASRSAALLRKICGSGGFKVFLPASRMGLEKKHEDAPAPAAASTSLGAAPPPPPPRPQEQLLTVNPLLACFGARNVKQLVALVNGLGDGSASTQANNNSTESIINEYIEAFRSYLLPTSAASATSGGSGGAVSAAQFGNSNNNNSNSSPQQLFANPSDTLEVGFFLATKEEVDSVISTGSAPKDRVAMVAKVVTAGYVDSMRREIAKEYEAQKQQQPVGTIEVLISVQRLKAVVTSTISQESFRPIIAALVMEALLQSSAASSSKKNGNGSNDAQPNGDAAQQEEQQQQQPTTEPFLTLITVLDRRSDNNINEKTVDSNTIYAIVTAHAELPLWTSAAPSSSSPSSSSSLPPANKDSNNNSNSNGNGTTMSSNKLLPFARNLPIYSLRKSNSAFRAPKTAQTPPPQQQQQQQQQQVLALTFNRSLIATFTECCSIICASGFSNCGAYPTKMVSEMQLMESLVQLGWTNVVASSALIRKLATPQIGMMKLHPASQQLIRVLVPTKFSEAVHALRWQTAPATPAITTSNSNESENNIKTMTQTPATTSAAAATADSSLTPRAQKFQAHLQELRRLAQTPLQRQVLGDALHVLPADGSKLRRGKFIEQLLRRNAAVWRATSAQQRDQRLAELVTSGVMQEGVQATSRDCPAHLNIALKQFVRLAVDDSPQSAPWAPGHGPLQVKQARPPRRRSRSSSVSSSSARRRSNRRREKNEDDDAGSSYSDDDDDDNDDDNRDRDVEHRQRSSRFAKDGARESRQRQEHSASKRQQRSEQQQHQQQQQQQRESVQSNSTPFAGARRGLGVSVSDDDPRSNGSKSASNARGVAGGATSGAAASSFSNQHLPPSPSVWTRASASVSNQQQPQQQLRQPEQSQRDKESKNEATQQPQPRFFETNSTGGNNNKQETKVLFFETRTEMVPPREPRNSHSSNHTNNHGGNQHHYVQASAGDLSYSTSPVRDDEVANNNNNNNTNGHQQQQQQPPFFTTGNFYETVMPVAPPPPPPPQQQRHPSQQQMQMQMQQRPHVAISSSSTMGATTTTTAVAPSFAVGAVCSSPLAHFPPMLVLEGHPVPRSGQEHLLMRVPPPRVPPRA